MPLVARAASALLPSPPDSLFCCLGFLLPEHALRRDGPDGPQKSVLP